MKTKVQINTWPKGQTQGSVIPLGISEMEVRLGCEQVTRRNGCCSAEIIIDCEVPTVMIGGRKFICDKPWGSMTGMEYVVSITPEFADTLKMCPHCKALL